MAPPRFQCLNAARQVSKKGMNLKAAFSTSRVSRSDERPPTSSTASLLDSLDMGSPLNPSPSSPPRPSRDAPLTNPLNQIRSQRLQSGNEQANQRIFGLIRKSVEQNARQRTQKQKDITAAEMENHGLAQGLTRQITRRWKAGDVYAPHDLSEVEMAKWKKRGQPTFDAFDMLGFNPKEHYRNFSIMSEYMTPMGRIKHSKETGLRPVNQRRIARAIRRTIGMGMMPSVHRHPEIIYKEMERSIQNSPFKATQGVAGAM